MILRSRSTDLTDSSISGFGLTSVTWLSTLNKKNKKHKFKKKNSEKIHQTIVKPINDNVHMCGAWL